MCVVQGLARTVVFTIRMCVVPLPSHAIVTPASDEKSETLGGAMLERFVASTAAPLTEAVDTPEPSSTDNVPVPLSLLHRTLGAATPSVTAQVCIAEGMVQPAGQSASDRGKVSRANLHGFRHGNGVIGT